MINNIAWSGYLRLRINIFLAESLFTRVAEVELRINRLALICILLLPYVIANKYLCDSYAQIGYKVPRSHCWVPQPLYDLMRDYILPCQEGGHQFIGTFIVKLWP